MLTGWKIMMMVAGGLLSCATGFSAESTNTGTTPAAPAAVTATPAAQPAEAATENAGPQPFQGTGVVLINPDNPAEAKLLVQIMVPGSDGVAKPEVIGLSLKSDDNSVKLVKDFGVKAVKPDDVEGNKKARAEAMQKFVKVDGVLNFDDAGPTLTVSKYEKSTPVVVQADASAGAPAAPDR